MPFRISMISRLRLSLVSFIVLLFLCNRVGAIPFPNGLTGIPEVECGEDTIVVVFNTQEGFEGKTFVKGFANDEKCVSSETGRRTTSIEINKNECGVTSLRSSDPPGLFVNVKLMISFHSQFITKVDRGFDIECFYMQATKTVTYPISVSMKPLDALQEVAEMPRCRYEVFEEGPTGPPAETVDVGDRLYHKWTCESSTPSIWCMTVHDCKVDDGKGLSVQILNEEGCAVDKYVLQNLEYLSPLMAGQEAHAFKFADEVAVNFQCSIRIDIRDDDGECSRPECPPLRRKRESEVITLNAVYHRPSALELDVRSQEIDVMDSKFSSQAADRSFTHNHLFKSRYCLSRTILGLLILLTMLLAVALVATCCIACFRSKN